MSKPKYCTYCEKTDHSDNECWSTRMVGWTPSDRSENFQDYSHWLLQQRKPFGYWHVGATEEESDFFLASESGNVKCPNCIPLYK